MQNSTTILGIIEMRLKGISCDDCEYSGFFEPPVRAVRATVPASESQASASWEPSYLL